MLTNITCFYFPSVHLWDKKIVNKSLYTNAFWLLPRILARGILNPLRVTRADARADTRVHARMANLRCSLDFSNPWRFACVLRTGLFVSAIRSGLADNLWRGFFNWGRGTQGFSRYDDVVCTIYGQPWLATYLYDLQKQPKSQRLSHFPLVTHQIIKPHGFEPFLKLQQWVFYFPPSAQPQFHSPSYDGVVGQPQDKPRYTLDAN